MTPYKIIIVTATLFATTALGMASNSFSTMGVDEISALIDMHTGNSPQAASAKEAVTTVSKRAPQPVSLTAGDMVTKVYGVVDPKAGKEECVVRTRTLLSLHPQEDEGVLWLESADGFVVDYYGMQPCVSAMARYDTPASGATDYGFFFLFPYTSGTRKQTIENQAEFCGLLLQEMADCGLMMDLNTATDDLFEAVGEHCGSLVDVRLVDDRQTPDSGRYILILSIEPDAFKPDDDMPADF